MKDFDVVVIGAGPAGLAAAIKAREGGVTNVAVVERGEHAGGLLDQCIHNGFGLHYFKEDLTGPEFAARLLEKASDLGVDILLETMVLSLGADRAITASNARGLLTLKPQAIVLAMGCRERSREALAIPGTRPSGILTAGTAQRYVNVEGVMPGKKFVILGSGDVGMIMARRLTLEGAEVSAVVEILPYVGGLIRNEVQCLRDFDIPLLLSHTVTEIHGRERVEAVTVAKVDANRQPIPGTEQRIECDTVLLSVGLIPENELSRMAGVELDPVTGGPVVDETMQTNVPGIFAGGNVVHVHDLVDNVAMEGELAGSGAAGLVLGKTGNGKRRLGLKAGANIRYVVPQRISTGRDVTVYARVKEPAENVVVRVGGVASRSIRAVKPSEMLKVTVPGKRLREVDENVVELTLSCERKG